MVQDPRVTRQLARLGGVYQDPARVNRDASTLLKSSVGANLQPIAAIHVDDTGDRHTVLVLQGTIAIYFRSNTYQLLIDIYLIPGYPNRPPVCYVRLAPNMYLKENHRHVGRDGKVYLPYLHEWKGTTHNLVELTVAMSSVFSADPPVFSRSSASSSATASSMPTATATVISSIPMATATTTRPPPFSQALSSSTTANADMNSWRDQQAQLEAMLAREAAEANAAAEAARLAEQREREGEERKERELQNLRAAVTMRIQTYLRGQQSKIQALVQDDANDQAQLKAIPLSRIQQDCQELRKKKSFVKDQLELVENKTQEIQVWLDDHKHSQQALKKEPVSIDDLVVPESAVHRQMLDLAAENASVSDALYVLDQALYSSKISVDQHLKTIRKLAKRQFLIRAHLLKIRHDAINV